MKKASPGLTAVMRRASLIDAGLAASDFPHPGVRIEHDDGSVFDLRFALIHRIGGWTVVFTEHHGFIPFATDDLWDVHVYKRKRKGKPRLRKLMRQPSILERKGAQRSATIGRKSKKTVT